MRLTPRQRDALNYIVTERKVSEFGVDGRVARGLRLRGLVSLDWAEQPMPGFYYAPSPSGDAENANQSNR